MNFIKISKSYIERVIEKDLSFCLRYDPFSADIESIKLVIKVKILHVKDELSPSFIIYCHINPRNSRHKLLLRHKIGALSVALSSYDVCSGIN